MFQWPGQHPEDDEPEERQIGVDPFSLRQFSRLNIDKPLPIPSVSVDDPPPPPAPARYASASASVPCSRQASPRLGSSAAAAAPTRWDAHLALASGHDARAVLPAACPASRAMSRSKSCAELLSDADNEFDVILSSPERRASAPQRWGSDVPLIADAKGGRNNKGRRKGNKHGAEAPFGCCLYLPGLARRTATGKPSPAPRTPAASTAARASSPGYFSATLRGPDDVVDQPEPADQCCSRPSTMSLAVSMEGFDCRFSSRSSMRFSSRSSTGMGFGMAQLDGEEASSSSYFDLPMELIMGCDGDEEGELPVHAAFLFDSDGIRKSVLRKGAGRVARPSSAAQVSAVGDASGAGRMSARHVRFSVTSGPAPSTPADS